MVRVRFWVESWEQVEPVTRMVAIFVLDLIYRASQLKPNTFNGYCFKIRGYISMYMIWLYRVIISNDFDTTFDEYIVLQMT